MTPTPNPPALLPVTQEPDISRIALWNILREHGVSQDIAQIIIAKAADASPALSTPAEPKVSREAVADIIAAKVSGPPMYTPATKQMHRLDQLAAADAILALSNPPADGDGPADKILAGLHEALGHAQGFRAGAEAAAKVAKGLRIASHDRAFIEGARYAMNEIARVIDALATPSAPLGAGGSEA